ncbi:hypothetical protein GCM10020000_16060 [Streptomyces olivoverticillatus]
MDVEEPFGLGSGAAFPQRAGGAALLELGGADAAWLWLAEVDGVSGRAGGRAGGGVDVEVVDGEAVGDGLAFRGGFDDRGVALPGQQDTEVAGAVGGVAQNRQPGLLGGQ